MANVIIIGGGVHGTFLSHALTRTGVLERDEITVIDPHPEPLAVWKRRTRNTGMTHLRSPSSHNMDIDFRALRAYARRQINNDAEGAFIAPYARPSLSLFNAHTEATIEAHRLTELRRHGRVHEIEVSNDGVIVHTDSERRTADYVILAVGRSEKPHIPRWARTADHPGVRHIFAPDFSPELLRRARAPVVVGGGVTAAQAACSAARLADTRVALLTRNPISVEQFDSEPCYIGPRCLRSFLATDTPTERRRLVDAARHPGTVPWDVARALEEESRVTITEDEISAAEPRGELIRLYLAGTDTALDTDLVVLATGFEREVPLDTIISPLAHRHGLPLGPAGFPVPDRYLRWHPRVLLTGSLAELELGPAAPNIIGAHLSARRLVPFFQGCCAENVGGATAAAAASATAASAAAAGAAAAGAAAVGPEIAWTALTQYVSGPETTCSPG